MPSQMNVPLGVVSGRCGTHVFSFWQAGKQENHHLNLNCGTLAQ